MDKNEFTNEFKVKGEELLKRVKEIIHEGNVRRIIIKDEKGNVFLEIPLTFGLVGAFLAPVWAAVGALAALVNNFNIEIVKKESDEDEEASAEDESPSEE